MDASKSNKAARTPNKSSHLGHFGLYLKAATENAKAVPRLIYRTADKKLCGRGLSIVKKALKAIEAQPINPKNWVRKTINFWILFFRLFTMEKPMKNIISQIAEIRIPAL